jgi:solute carrier family 24 (sodium/potassium/calcium exchanger), member 6
MMRKSGVFNTNNEDEDNNTYKQWRRLLGKANTLKTNQRPGLEEVSMNAEEEQKRIDYCTGWRINEQEDKCRYITKYECNQETDSVVTNYLHFHHCTMQGHSAVSVAMLVMVVALSFYVLGDTAEEFFCPVVRRVAWWLRLSPNTAGVTLLALGNGAPDVFASLAAFSSGDGGSGEIGAGMIGAIVSAGTFVSGGVVGAVAVVAAPFEVPKVAFLRDAWFYFFGAVLVCYVVTSGEVYPMHAIGFILYYVSFVCLVIFSDIRERKRRERLNISPSVVDEELLDIHTDASSSSHEQIEVDWYDEPPVHEVLGQNIIGWCQTNGKTRYMLFKALVHAPLDICRRMTIPSAEPERWNRFYALSSVSLGPLLLLHQLKDIVDAKMLIGNDFVGFLPLWMCVLIPSTLIGCAVFVASNHSHQPEFWPIALALAFGTSIVWISLAATELLECLTVLGHISGISPAVLGVTVLAWGNSVGDLVADVVIAKGGQPTMAVAACYSGPMFNMCVGLGLAFALQAIELSPAPLTLLTHANIPISFMFLFASLFLSLTYVPAKKFRITKPFGVTLILMYALSNVIMITLEIGQHV